MTRMTAAFALRLRRATPPRFARGRTLLCVCLAAGSLAAAQAQPYSRSFTGGTMRVDFLHTGGPGGETLALDRLVRDGPWPGSRTRLIDDTNLGESFFEVNDRGTGRTKLGLRDLGVRVRRTEPEVPVLVRAGEQFQFRTH